MRSKICTKASSVLQPSLAMLSPSNKPSVDLLLLPATLPRGSHPRQIDSITLGAKVHQKSMLQIPSCGDESRTLHTARLTDMQIKAVSSLSRSTIKFTRHVVRLPSASCFQDDEIELEEMSEIAKVSPERSSHSQGCHHTDVASSCLHSDECLVETRLRNARRKQRVPKLQSEI